LHNGMAKMVTYPNLEQFDNRFIEIYEQARRAVIDEQKRKGLLIAFDDQLQLYHSGREVQIFEGMQPLAYHKLKSNGHIPMALFCMLSGAANGNPLPEPKLHELATYAKAVKSGADDLDLSEEIREGKLLRPVHLYDNALAFIETVLAARCVSRDQLATFARDVEDDINIALAAAARSQLDACHDCVMRIRGEILSAEEWSELRVLVLGPYMARQGDLYLQYFAKVLNTPEQGDRRLVYFEGDDVDAALERLGTAILDTHASQAIFTDRDRLHRDVLADETTRYLDTHISR